MLKEKIDDKTTERLIEILDKIGLDVNWRKAVIALCAQENAIRKKLKMLGAKSGDQDFQKVAELLQKKMKEEGQEPPDILLSLARSYPHIRGKLVHSGYSKSIDYREVESILINTSGLLEILFETMPKELNQYKTAQILLELEKGDVKPKIDELSPDERKGIFIALLEMYTLSDDISELNEIKATLLTIMKFKINEIYGLIDVSIQRYESVVPHSLIIDLLKIVVHLPSIADYLKKKGYINWIVSCFAESESFIEASERADIILKINSILTETQIQSVLMAIVENSQIYGSFGVKRKLSSFVEDHWKREQSPFDLDIRERVAIVESEREHVLT